ncbi:MAG: hypothetical protein RIQ81_454 [Pseudomonadota bacterium]|jgi:cell division protein FtsZ
MGFEPELINPPGAKIKVIGVGGGGGNAVNTMIRAGLDCVEFISANTDVQALRFSMAATHIQIGKELTKGLGAGADPDVGRESALEDRKDIEAALKGADMVFITAGMGGGTGTGGAAVIAQIARELGALTVAVVTKPFNFEGKRRRKYAEAGIARLREAVDTLITIPNQRLLQIATPDLSMIDAFKMADNVVVNAVRGISDIINVPGLINADFADVKTVMSNMGHSLMGIGHATGPKRAAEAARMAISSPLLDDLDIQGATGVLISITAGSSLGLMEVDEICTIVQESAHEDATSIWGAVIDESLGDAIRVTVIATGFPVDSGATTSNEILRPAHTAIYSPNYATGADVITGQRASTTNVTPAKPVALTATSPERHSQPMAAMQPDTISQQKIEAIAEAQELARWTIDQTTAGEDLPIDEEIIPAQQGAPSAHASELTEFETSLDDASTGEPNRAFEEEFEAVTEEETTAVNVHGADVASSIFDDSFADDDLQDLAATADAPIESFFEAGLSASVAAQEAPVNRAHSLEMNNMDLTGDIDRKIDEALALAQKLRAAGATAKAIHPAGGASAKPQVASPHTANEGLDDLDVPAFLRNANQDISLD